MRTTVRDGSEQWNHPASGQDAVEGNEDAICSADRVFVPFNSVLAASRVIPLFASVSHSSPHRSLSSRLTARSDLEKRGSDFLRSDIESRLAGCHRALPFEPFRDIHCQ